MWFNRKRHSIEEYQHAGKVLKARLDLSTELVALKYLKGRPEIPEGYTSPLKDLGRKMTICMAMAAARKEGLKFAITAHDNPCTPASAVHGWVKVPMWPLIMSQVENKWQKNALSVIRVNNKRKKLGGWLAQYPYNRLLGHRGVLVSPLSKTDFVPDTVVVYSNPEQMLNVAHAFSFEGKYLPRAVLTGFSESCFSAGLIPLKSKTPVFVLLGMGDRTIGKADLCEVAMGMPGVLIFYVIKNLHKSGGEYNLKNNLDKWTPPDQLDESLLPGWADVRRCIRQRQ